MKLYNIFESSEVTKISDSQLQDACELINDGGQLSWTLTPSRLKGKLGSIGKIFGLYIGGQVVGTIGLKEININGVVGVEVGYLYLHPEYRTFSNYVQLYTPLISVASQYNFIYLTTVTTNTVINKLMNHNSNVKHGFTSKSPFSSNMLNYWVARGTKMDVDSVVELLQDKFMITESINNFKLVFTNTDNAGSLSNSIKAIAKASPHIELSDTVENGQVEVRFGKGSLPMEQNKIVVGNKYYSKESQYNLLKDKVPMLPTVGHPDELKGEFIAKKKNSQRQQGQMVNKVPDNPSEYIFQPLVDILSEYRVICYWMNGEYHISGVYEKFGSNASLTSITSGQIYDQVTKVAKEATKILGYGVGGVDIIMTKSKVHESIGNIAYSLGGVMSKAGKLKGAMSKKGVQGSIYLLEVNTLPSLSNPMILYDLVKSIRSNIK